MIKCYRHGVSLLTGVLAIVSAILLALAIGTTEWLRSDIIRIVKHGSNGTTETVDAGYKYFGMFRGCEEKKFGALFASRRRCFEGILITTKNYYFLLKAWLY